MSQPVTVAVWFSPGLFEAPHIIADIGGGKQVVIVVIVFITIRLVIANNIPQGNFTNLPSLNSLTTFASCPISGKLSH